MVSGKNNNFRLIFVGTCSPNSQTNRNGAKATIILGEGAAKSGSGVTAKPRERLGFKFNALANPSELA